MISGLLSGFPLTPTTSAASTTYSIGAAKAGREIEESRNVPRPKVVDSVNLSSRSFNTLPLELNNTPMGVTSTSSLQMMRNQTTAKATLGNAGKCVNCISAAPAVTVWCLWHKHILMQIPKEH